MNSILYTPYKIDGLEIKNRFTASAVLNMARTMEKLRGKLKNGTQALPTAERE